LLVANALLQRERGKAVENFRQTRATIRRFVALANEGQGKRTVEDLRRAIGATAKQYYEEFLRERTGDPSLMAELAWTHYQLASFILLELGERANDSKAVPPPSPPPVGSTSPRPPESPPAASERLGPSWSASLEDADRNNATAISLYKGLIERHHEPKEREYQLCLQQKSLIETLRRAPDQTAVSSITGLGSVEDLATGGIPTMIGD
jgi:hypothetical protein